MVAQDPWEAQTQQECPCNFQFLLPNFHRELLRVTGSPAVGGKRPPLRKEG